MTQPKPFMLRTSVRSWWRRNWAPTLVGEFSWRVGLLPDRKFRHGSSRALQNFSLNEIGADKIRHQPLAKASGMDRAVEQQPCTWHSAHSCTLSHSCTLTHLHSYTPARLHAYTLARISAKASGMKGFRSPSQKYWQASEFWIAFKAAHQTAAYKARKMCRRKLHRLLSAKDLTAGTQHNSKSVTDYGWETTWQFSRWNRCNR